MGGGGGGTGPPPPPPPRDCAGPFKFMVDQIAKANALPSAAGLQVGDEVRVKLDDEGDAAVFVGNQLLGWPVTFKVRLRECLEQGYKYKGPVVERRGSQQAPYVEVRVKGQP